MPPDADTAMVQERSQRGWCAAAVQLFGDTDRHIDQGCTTDAHVGGAPVGTRRLALVLGA